PSQQPDTEEQVTGPAVKVAFNNGQPTPAAHAFAKKVDLDLSKIDRVNLPKEISSIYWPKSMYWRSKGERFIRPVRWLVAMLDEQVVPLEFAGIRAGSESRGHRTLGKAVRIRRPADYEPSLENVAVVAKRETREHRIRKALDAATRTVTGARWREDKDLLDTVVNLTEWPSVIVGGFDPEFLDLPEEVLVTVMRDHQKYFAVEDSSVR